MRKIITLRKTHGIKKTGADHHLQTKQSILNKNKNFKANLKISKNSDKKLKNNPDQKNTPQKIKR